MAIETTASILTADSAPRYIEIIRRELTEKRGFRDYLRYDDNGDLWIGELRVVDLAQFGTPFEICYTPNVERRCNDFRRMTLEATRAAGYQGGVEYHYAGKANMSSDVIVTALRSGWHIETTNSQDLTDIRWLEMNGLFDKKKTKIICNGFKLPPDQYGIPAEQHRFRSRLEIVPDANSAAAAEEVYYADYIILMRQEDFEIMPILDWGEADHFLRSDLVPPMDVGLRHIAGKVKSAAELKTLKVRHGMAWEQILEEAERIDHTPHLTLRMLHFMVGAAETIPVDTFIESLMVGAEQYFKLQSRHNTLQYFNVGGGVPALTKDYDHQALLQQFFAGVKDMAKSFKLPEPTIVYELGSFIATESEFDVTRILQMKQNSLTADGNPDTWAICDTNIMDTLPDIWYIHEKFPILAANNANEPAIQVTISDITCDSGSVFPGQVWIPKTTKPTFMVFAGTGAYQNLIAGEGGMHHCGLSQGVDWKINKRRGQLDAVMLPRQHTSDGRKILGYTQDALERLK